MSLNKLLLESLNNFLFTFLYSMMVDISTSWNVVKLAQVFCDCLSLSPIFCFILLKGYLIYCLSKVPDEGMKEGPLGVYGFFAGAGLLSAAGLDDLVSVACFFSYFFQTFSFSYLGFSAGVLFSPFASVSISKKGFPTSKLSPYCACNLVSLPSLGDLMSTVTLSVSITATISSKST